MRILALYDGTIQAKVVLRYGLGKAKGMGSELIVLHVFPNNIFTDYEAGPQAEAVARAEAKRYLEQAKNIIDEAGAGGIVRILSGEGDPAEVALQVAEAERVDLLLASPRYKALVRKAACPVYVMPGIILVPVDSSDALLADKGLIIEEARAAESKVLIVGIIPVHLYSKEETAEIERVKTATLEIARNLKNALSGSGIEVSETLGAGYPDEEILKAARECSASLIMLPAGGKTPSELSKAAAILLDEPERLRLPIRILASVAS